MIAGAPASKLNLQVVDCKPTIAYRKFSGDNAWSPKLFESAQKRWRWLNGAQYLKAVLAGVAFQDGIRVESEAA